MAADPAQLVTAKSFAVLFGMVHALMPGHGKSVLVSYHLGRPGRLAHGVATISGIHFEGLRCTIVRVRGGRVGNHIFCGAPVKLDGHTL